MSSADDSPTIQIRADDSRCSHELGISRDHPGNPVDVRGLERGHLPKRVAMELAELQLDCQRVSERRRDGWPEATHTSPPERTSRIRGA